MRFEMTITRHRTVLAAALGLCLISAGPALADGGGSGGGGGSGSTTCPPGQVYDANSQSCVKQGSEVIPDKALTDYAYALAKAERYDEALDVLNLLKNPNTPEALNYRGYATRKLGRVDEGIGYYRKSIALDPRYAKVREYLGEAYVIKGEIGQAKAQLHAIKTICGTACEQYQHLALAISNRGATW
ncbi:MAG: tetratricopeptide repeat protein [Alphaproteobacteria bacterium]